MWSSLYFNLDYFQPLGCLKFCPLHCSCLQKADLSISQCYFLQCVWNFKVLVLFVMGMADVNVVFCSMSLKEIQSPHVSLKSDQINVNQKLSPFKEVCVRDVPISSHHCCNWNVQSEVCCTSFELSVAGLS